MPRLTRKRIVQRVPGSIWKTATTFLGGKVQTPLNTAKLSMTDSACSCRGIRYFQESAARDNAMGIRTLEEGFLKEHHRYEIKGQQM